MPHAYAHAVELVTTALAVIGLGYGLTSLVAAYIYLARRAAQLRQQAQNHFTPAVSILKSLKGLDAGMMEAFRSHCRQTYAGQFELLFGVQSMDDEAVPAVLALQREFPHLPIHLIECPLTLGTNGKVSTLVQLAPHAAHDYFLINDSDITVSPRYLERVMASFAEPGKRAVGLVTAIYRGHAHRTIPSHLESLGVSTDFFPSFLVSILLEGGIHFGLGGTLAASREAVKVIGGLETLVDVLADDYELGLRIHKAGYRVVIAPDPVETSVPPYDWRGFLDHQLRWYRTIRDARPGGYAGLVLTCTLPLALLNALASGLSPLSLWLVALAFFLRLAVAMTVGVAILRDHQVLPTLWLLPLRDMVAMGLWVASFASNVVVWRGQRFVVSKGKMLPVKREP